jgi:hypothetical protein
LVEQMNAPVKRKAQQMLVWRSLQRCDLQNRDSLGNEVVKINSEAAEAFQNAIHVRFGVAKIKLHTRLTLRSPAGPGP